MKLKSIILPILVLGLAACGSKEKGPKTIVVKEGNAVTEAADEVVTKKGVVLSTVLSTDKTKGDYNSVILGSEDGYIAVSTYGLDAAVVNAWKEVKVGDTLTFDGKVAASTGGEFGKGGIKQLYPQGEITLATAEKDQLVASFPEVATSNVVDLSDWKLEGDEITESENFRTWYNSVADEVALFGHRVTFKNVKFAFYTDKDTGANQLPGEDNTNQGYFMSSTKIISEVTTKEGSDDKTVAVRASIYHTSLPADFDAALTYDVTAVFFGANNPMHTYNQKPILRFGVAPAMSIVAHAE